MNKTVTSDDLFPLNFPDLRDHRDSAEVVCFVRAGNASARWGFSVRRFATDSLVFSSLLGMPVPMHDEVFMVESDTCVGLDTWPAFFATRKEALTNYQSRILAGAAALTETAELLSEESERAAASGQAVEAYDLESQAELATWDRAGFRVESVYVAEELLSGKVRRDRR